MGTTWSVLPLDEQMTNWLNQQKVAYPGVPSRFPTGRELKEVLEGIPEYEVGVSDNGLGRAWQAFITAKTGADTGGWTRLTVFEYTGDDQEQKFVFERGWENVVTDVVRAIAGRCGPLVVIEHGNGTPYVITPSTCNPANSM